MLKGKAWASAATSNGLCLSCSAKGVGLVDSAGSAVSGGNITHGRRVGWSAFLVRRSSGQPPSHGTGMKSGPRSTVDSSD